MALTVAPSTKLVAVAIAQRAGASSGLAWPGMGTLATDTGLHRSSVIRAVKELEQGGHLTVTRFKVGKKNASNRYRLPPMQSSTVTPPSLTVTLPPSLTVEPEPVRTLEPVKKAAAPLPVPDPEGVDEKPQAETGRADRHVCPCGHSWPKSYGTVCFSPSCNQPKRSGYNAGLAAPEPHKYDFLDAPGPRKGGIQAEYARCFAIAHAEKPSRREFQRSDGSWSELPGGCT